MSACDSLVITSGEVFSRDCAHRAPCASTFLSLSVVVEQQRSCRSRDESVQLGCRSFTLSPLSRDRWHSHSQAV